MNWFFSWIKKPQLDEKEEEEKEKKEKEYNQ
jgi:hypothetical protein